jgi:putative metallohydrolase (TIGR04338 family)
MILTAREGYDFHRNITSKERDNQRSKLYKAERATSMWKNPKRLDTVKDIEKFVERVQARKSLRKRFGYCLGRHVEVLDGRGRRSACGGSWGIKMPIWSRNELIVCHELAHTINIRMCGSRVAGHGWQFANIYLQLVQSMMGKDAADELKASFKKHRVRFNPKKAVPLHVAELLAA